MQIKHGFSHREAGMLGPWIKVNSVQFSSVQSLSHVRLCEPMNLSMPGLPVHHQLPEFTQTHVHRVSDAIQPSHPLSSPLPPAPNFSQHQSLFQWVNSSHEVAKVLEFQPQHHFKICFTIFVCVQVLNLQGCKRLEVKLTLIFTSSLDSSTM